MILALGWELSGAVSGVTIRGFFSIEVSDVLHSNWLNLEHNLALEVTEYHFRHTAVLVKIRSSRFAWGRYTLYLSTGRVAKDWWPFVK